MKFVPIGQMRDRVEIQSRTLSADSFGGQVASWTTVATVAAKVEPLSGREAWQAQQVRPDLTHKVTIRYYAGLGPEFRFLLGSRRFAIESVIDTESRRRQHECMCKEEV